jgi:hypothetical protein
MIPDRLPSGASAGEKQVLALLQRLPDDVIVYYEHFIVIMPRTGLLVIKVKGWYPNSIERADAADVVISARGRREVCRANDRRGRMVVAERRLAMQAAFGNLCRFEQTDHQIDRPRTSARGFFNESVTRAWAGTTAGQLVSGVSIQWIWGIHASTADRNRSKFVLKSASRARTHHEGTSIQTVAAGRRVRIGKMKACYHAVGLPRLAMPFR